jgi:hypothetical protein
LPTTGVEESTLADAQTLGIDNEVVEPEADIDTDRAQGR